MARYRGEEMSSSSEPNAPLVVSKIGSLGKGTYGNVELVCVHGTGEVVARKTILLFLGQDTCEELEIFRSLRHCNVVELKWHYFEQADDAKYRSLHLGMDYVPDTLHECLRRAEELAAGSGLPCSSVRLYGYQVFRALAYIHSMGISHGDITPTNLLLDTKRGVVKICDFRTSRLHRNGQGNSTVIGTFGYRAPELVYHNTGYTYAVDMWSSGCVLAEMILGKPLFSNKSREATEYSNFYDILGKPSQGQFREIQGLPACPDGQSPRSPRGECIKLLFRKKRVPDALVDLVSKLVTYSPRERLSPLNACAHEFFSEPPLTFDFRRRI